MVNLQASFSSAYSQVFYKKGHFEMEISRGIFYRQSTFFFK